MKPSRWVPLADQVLANASNALFAVLVAGLTSPAAFGRYSVGYAVLVFAVGAWRNGLGYQISMKSGDPAAVIAETNRATAATLLVSPGLAATVFLVAGVGDGADLGLAWGLALATPFVLFQDLLRYSAVAAKRAGSALASDAVWTGLLVIATGLRIANLLSATALVTLWAAGALIAAAMLVKSLKVRPHFGGALSWIRDSWSHRMNLIGGGLVASVSVPITAGILAFTAGPEVAGGVAGAGLLMAPVNSLVAWLSLTLLARTADLDGGGKQRHFVKAGLSTSAVALGWGLALLAVPATLGTLLLGSTWTYAIQALPVIGTQYALAVLATTGNLLLVSTNRTREVLVVGFATALARVGLGTIAAIAVGTVFAASVAETLAMMVILVAVMVCLRAPQPLKPRAPTSQV